MRYMLLLYVDERPEPDTPEAAEFYPPIAEFYEECHQRGVLVAADSLQRPETTTTVRVRDGGVLNTDGPFAETAEWLGGYFMLECRDLDVALELPARHPTAKEGSVEVRPVWEVSEPGGPVEIKGLADVLRAGGRRRPRDPERTPVDDSRWGCSVDDELSTA